MKVNFSGEVWRIVPSQPQFIVSSEGRIMVIPYNGGMPNGGERQYGGEPNLGVWDKIDGRFIYFYKGKTYKLHRLICEAFHGASPHDNAVCLHIDENAANNRASNLKWGTQKENLNAPAFKRYCEARKGKNNPREKAWFQKSSATV